jgi:hypothetical protein
MKSFHWVIRFALVIHCCLPALFAAIAAPKIVVVYAKDAKAAEKTLSAAEVAAKVEQAVKFLGEKRAVSEDAIQVCNQQLQAIVSGVTPKNLAPLVIKKIKDDAAIINKILTAYDYTAINTAQTPDARQLACAKFFGETGEEYGKQSHRDEWRFLARHVFGDMYADLVEPKAEKIFRQYMVLPISSYNGHLNASIAIALYNKYLEAWLAFVEERAAKLP